MNSISENEVKKIANLTRLDLSAEEITKFGGQLARILDYVATLAEAPVADVAPFSPATVNETAFRADTIGQTLAPAQALQNAPQTDGRYFQTPLVVQG
jgi:aspartyl-tRNA(Asn)/glutamyl-tRNA(Gln) amidotransferase subunit C